VAINFPTSLDNFTNPVSGNTLDSPSHSLQHSDLNDAVEALEAKLGVGASPAGSATSGYVLTAGSGGTTTWSAAPRASAVSFMAQVNTNQSINSGAYTKVQFGTEVWDTDSAYDPTTNYRFTVPTGKGGKYLIGFDLNWGVYTAGHQVIMYLYKNGSGYLVPTFFWRDGDTDVNGMGLSHLCDLAAGDYIEAFVYHNRGVAATLYSPNCKFWGFQI